MCEDPTPRLEDASGFRGQASRLWTPDSDQELRSILLEATKSHIPVTVMGAGTGVTGGGVPQGGWAVSLARFRRLEIRKGEAVAGAGITLSELQQAAAATGQFFAPDPTEPSASLGGIIATNASGSRSLLYGSTRSHILGLRALLMDGRLMNVEAEDQPDFPLPPVRRPAVRKNAAGYYLTPQTSWIQLLAGSEGTLAVITEARLRLLAAPAGLLAGVVFFPHPEPCLDAVSLWRDISGLRMLEYFDQASLSLLRKRFAEVPVHAQAALLFEQLTEPDKQEEDAAAWIERLESAGADLEGSWFAASNADRERFRRFRHALPELVNGLVRQNGFQKMGTDFAVPAERNREMMDIYRRELEASFPGQSVIFGHIGDAHVHVNLLPRSPEDVRRGKELIETLAAAAVGMGGTVSAEHGLGKRKAHLLRLQYTDEEIRAMCEVKRRLDPHWLLGRGTLLPVPEEYACQ